MFLCTVHACMHVEVKPTPPAECYTGEWQCANGDCIYDSLRCNDVVDCNDGSDEVDCGMLIVVQWSCLLLRLQSG
jgi:hypothetical protein